MKVAIIFIHLLLLTNAIQVQAAQTAEPLAALKQFPALYSLYQSYPSYHKGFVDYANRQGFRQPIENLATVVHETIHIDSMVHQGYFIDGVYYEPYLRRDAWPTLTNEQVSSSLFDYEKGVIYRFYVLNTPKNNLGNVVDEINAYGHVLSFVCRNEPDSTEKQVANLIGFLNLTEGYLRTLRTAFPAEYQRFASQNESRGVFILVTQRAWKALRECGVSEGMIPTQESAYFMKNKQ